MGFEFAGIRARFLLHPRGYVFIRGYNLKTKKPRTVGLRRRRSRFFRERYIVVVFRRANMRRG